MIEKILKVLFPKAIRKIEARAQAEARLWQEKFYTQEAKANGLALKVERLIEKGARLGVDLKGTK